MTETQAMSSLVERLRLACVGRPAKIQWPHRVLCDAANEIERLQEALDGLLPFAEWLLSDMTKERDPSQLRKAIEAARAALEDKP